MIKDVYAEIICERRRQIELWGQQDWPDFNPVMTAVGVYDRQSFAEEYEIPSEVRAKFLCETAFSRGQGTWTHIAIEELAEAVGSTNSTDLRGELIQLAAVCVAWVEAIDRRA